MAIVWLILKIILWIVLCLLGLIFILLILPITANLEYSKKEGFSLSVGVWRLQYPIFPEKEKKQEKQEAEPAASAKEERPKETLLVTQKEPAQKPKEQPAKQPQNPAERKQPAAKAEPSAAQSAPKQEPAKPPKSEAKSSEAKSVEPPQRKPEKDLHRLLHTAAQAVSLAGGVVRRLLAGIWIHSIRVHLPIYAGDASETAIRVGRIYAAAGASLGVLKNFLHLSFKQYEIIPDYTNEKAEEAFFSCKITSALIIMVVVGVWALPKAFQIFKEM